MAHKAVRTDEDQFVKFFLELPRDVDLSRCPKPELVDNPFAELEGAQNTGMLEAQISARMTAAINGKGLIPGLKMRLAENAPDPLTIDDVGQKIDAALFPDSLEFEATDFRPHWADQLVPVEFKRDPVRGDPFDDRKDDDSEIDADALDRKKVRGQIIHYSELIHSVQHRVHLFMLLIMGRKCRMLRWDRSGVIISRSFDYYENWEFFCDVLWRISVLARFDPARLGHDPSAIRLSPGTPEWNMMTEAGEPHEDDVDHQERTLKPDELKPGEPFTFKYVRALFRESLKDAWPRYRLEVPDGEMTRTYYVCRPYFRAKGMIGRGTRGYVALEIENHKHRFRWLKDAWRVDYDGVSLEGTILQQLNGAGVKNIPTLVCHGDIHSQKTKSPDLWEEVKNARSGPNPQPLASTESSSRTLVEPEPGAAGSKRKRMDDVSAEGPAVPHPLSQSFGEETSLLPDSPFRRHAHYRLVVEEVCMPLSMFTNGQQLVLIIVDCITAHYMASNEGILHRDVSGGNILIYPTVKTIIDKATGKETSVLQWAGRLTDWELSKRLDMLLARQPERTGTWQYMSVAILLNPFKIVEIPDDLESFLYVLLYYAIRYLNSNCKHVADWIEEFFDCFTVTDGSYTCGAKKERTVVNTAQLSAPGVNSIVFGSPLDYLFTTLLQSFKAHYAVTLYEQRPHIPPPNPSATSSDALAPSLLPPVYIDDRVPDLGLDEEDMAEAIDVEYVPTANDRALAANVRSHKRMLNVISRALVKPGWLQGDKAPADRVPEDWKPTKALGPTVISMTNTSRNKRRRMESKSQSIQGVIAASLQTPTKPSRSGRSVVGRKK